MVQGQESNGYFIATGVYFHLSDMLIVSWGNVLEEANSFDQHATLLYFDGACSFATEKYNMPC